MLTITRERILPTTMTGSYPKPHWHSLDLQERSFKQAMGHSPFREQYLDAVAAVIAEQAAAGLDIVTDGDLRFDTAVGGKSWMFYLLDRLGGLTGRRDLAPNWSSRDFNISPGQILYEVMEAYQAPVVTAQLQRGPFEYPAVWKSAQRLSDRPVKFGTISAQCLVRMMWNAFYPNEREMILALSDIMNEELRELAASGCPLIQVEEPRHHLASMAEATTESDFEFFTEAFNREVKGVAAEIWVHTCWGNPAQQRLFTPVPSYERVLPYLFRLDADVITFECASTGGRDLPLIGKIPSTKKVAIGVVNHTTTNVETPSEVAALVRKALQYIPAERLIISTDCGFGREGLSRRIAFFKCVALVQGTNIVRRELGLPEVHSRAADPRFAFASAPG
jgi:5-methyltetrahydropteroyltriglutamate--homocysteine methyltransferase